MALNRHQTSYQLDHRGALNSTDHRIFFRDGTNRPISPWHDVQLLADQEMKLFRLVNLQPRWAGKWFALASREPLNPIYQKTENNQIKFVPKLFPHHGAPVNFGFIPQTLVPNYTAAGDKPNVEQLLLIFAEIGERVLEAGEVIMAKILGCFAVIINCQITWFLLVIDASDPIADLLNDVEDIKKYKPQKIKGLQEWFWRFKVFYVDQQRPESYLNLNFDLQLKNRQMAVTRLLESHRMWLDVMYGSKPIVGNLELTNTTLSNQHTVTPIVGNAIISQRIPTKNLPPLPIDQTLANKWYFGHLNINNKLF